MIRFLVPLLLTTLLVACGSPSNVEAPAELKSFKKLYNVNVLWQQSVGSMASSGGRMNIATSGNSLYVINDAGQISSLDVKSGKPDWSKNYDTTISTGIASGDSLLAFATRDGKVTAVSAKDGTQMWSTSVDGAVLSVPAIGSGKIYVQTEDGRVLALSETDGTVQWTLERTVPSLSLRGNSGVIYKQGLLVVGFANGHVVGIDSRNGRSIWDRVVSFPTGRSDVDRIADVDSPPLISGYMMFAVSYQGKVMAMDLRTGQVMWSRAMSSYLPESADATNLYLVNDEGVVLALNQVNGSDAWVQNNLKRRISTRPLAYDGKIVLGDKEGYIHILGASTGTIVGRYHLDSSKVLSHLVVGSELYSLTQDGHLIAYTIDAK